MIAPRMRPIWHDVECGAYAADLALWASSPPRPPGRCSSSAAGTGRVALALGRAGHEVVAVDSSPALLDGADATARLRRGLDGRDRGRRRPRARARAAVRG